MAQSRLTLLACLLGCVVWAACSGREAGVRSVLYDPAHPFPRTPADAPVPVFSDKGPECAFVAIGTVSAERRGSLPSRETMSAMTRAARRIGGEAIVALGTSGTLLAGTVIRFRDSTCTR
jgi:hypothetical protein